MQIISSNGLKCKQVSTICKQSKDETSQNIDEKLYRAMIGSFMYLTATRPYVCLVVGLCAPIQTSLITFHLATVKHIIKYVKGTVEYGMFYTKQTNQNLVCFCEVDWKGSFDDQRCTSRGCFFFGNNLISWHKKKQNSVSVSIVSENQMNTLPYEADVLNSCG